MQNNLTSPKKKKLPKRGVIAAVGVVVVIFALLEFTNTTHVLHKAPTPLTASAFTKGEPKNASEQNDQSNRNSAAASSTNGQPGDQKSASGGTATTSLLTPTGDFVSNHRPNLSGSPAPNTISSVCTTSPGATCVVSFTKDNVTKSLSAQTTDRGGSAYWNWKLQDIGLTVGSWKIEARATLGDKTVTAADAMELVVAQ